MAKSKTSLTQRLERLLLDNENSARPSHILREIESAAVSLSDRAQENLSDLIEWMQEAEALAQAGRLGDLTAKMEKKATRDLPPVMEGSPAAKPPSKSKRKRVELIGPPEPGTLTTATLFTDGGARGNPGPAAIGLVMKSETDEVVWTHGETIGDATNNVAEYSALICGLSGALEAGIKRLDVFLDAELIVKQLTGEYRVKNIALKPLFEEVRALRRRLDYCRVQHIPRAKNRHADQLVNQALDDQAGGA
jgi:ribonuclease HI